MLSDRQNSILEYIREQHAATGLMPTTREIQKHFGYASQTSVQDILSALQKKGVLQRLAGKARALVLASEFERAPIIDIPIYGMIPAGMPADQPQEADGCVSIDLHTVRLSKCARVFALKVRGDSMINAGILDGDTVVMEHRTPRFGEVVAALIDGETTLKRFVQEKGVPYLKAENPRYPDLIPARELIIQGVQVALFRTHK